MATGGPPARRLGPLEGGAYGGRLAGRPRGPLPAHQGPQQSSGTPSAASAAAGDSLKSGTSRKIKMVPFWHRIFEPQPYGTQNGLWVKTNEKTALGEFTTHFRTYFSGDWDVHWGYNLDFDPWPLGTQQGLGGEISVNAALFGLLVK